MYEKSTFSEPRDGLLINDRDVQQVEFVDPRSLKVLGNNPRSHPSKQQRVLRNAIRELGFLTPVLIDHRNRIIAGHARVVAAIDLGMREIPAIRISHLSEAETRAFRIADNRLVELGEWDRETLAIEFRDLLDIDFQIELTGFETPEIDIVLESTRNLTPEPDVEFASGPPVTQLGDLWVLNSHRVLCGDARSRADHRRLLGHECATMTFSDPPYNVPIAGNVSGLGRTRSIIRSAILSRPLGGGLTRCMGLMPEQEGPEDGEEALSAEDRRNRNRDSGPRRHQDACATGGGGNGLN